MESSEPDDVEKSASKKAPYLPPCRICMNVASGFHYGVNTCEACKGFYRRSIARRTPYSCSGIEDCEILLDRRSACPACRYKKCLSVGMNKDAIKTGRYTHEKRTNDTLEIKRSVSSTEITHSDSDQLPNEQDASNLSDTSALPNLSNDSIPKLDSETVPPDHAVNVENCKLYQTLNLVHDAFRNSFRDATYLFEEPQRIEDMIRDIMKERNTNDITELVAHIGADASPEQKEHFNRLTLQAQTVQSIKAMNNSIPQAQLWQLDSYVDATKRLFEIWSSNVEKLIQELIRFAKKLPGFSSLPAEDQIILVKSARSEVTTLVKFKHLRQSPDAFIDYRTDSGSLCIIPSSTLRLMFTGINEEKTDYSILYGRSMRQMSMLGLRLEHLALECAIVLFSSDREGLSEESKVKVAELQEELADVLKYSLGRTHPKGKSMFARFLMLLPLLRELSEHNNQSLMDIQERFNPDLSPLLFEVMTASPIDNSTQSCGQKQTGERD